MATIFASPYLVDVHLTVDGKDCSFTISRAVYNRTYNKASTLVLEIIGSYSLDLFHIGAAVSIKAAKGVGEGANTRDNPPADTRTLHFEGFVRVIRPTENGGTVTIADALSLLSTSQVKEFKKNDYLGRDMYYAAASVIDDLNNEATSNGDTLGFYDFYGGKWLNTSRLKQGCDLAITDDLNIFGYQTSKQFIDKIFANLYKTIDASDYLANEYQANKVYYLPYYYNISYGNVVDFYTIDLYNNAPRISLELNENNPYILKDSMSTQIDATRQVNSATVVSSLDSSIFARYDDTASQALFGVKAAKYTSSSTEYDFLEDVARRYVERYKSPSYSYTLSIRHQLLLSPGDTVRVLLPTAGVDEILPVLEVSTVMENGYAEQRITFGERKLPSTELLTQILNK